MIRLTFFYLFSSLAVLSVLLLFFTKNNLKTSVLFANAFLCSSLVCVIFRRPIVGLAVLVSGALCSYIYLYLSGRLEKDIVRAKGITPKYLKIFSGLCCAAFFFALMSTAGELKYSSDLSNIETNIEKSVNNAPGSYVEGTGTYIAALAVFALFSPIVGRMILSYKEKAKDDKHV